MSSFIFFYAGDVQKLGEAFRGLDPEDHWPSFLAGHAACEIPRLTVADLVLLAIEARSLAGLPPKEISTNDFGNSIGDAFVVPFEWIESFSTLSTVHVGDLGRRWLAAISRAYPGPADPDENASWLPDVEDFLGALIPVCRLTVERGCGMVYGC